MRKRQRILLLVPIALAVGFFVLPILGLFLRTTPEGWRAALGSPAIRSALWLSLLCPLAATLVSGVLGLPLAAWLAGGRSHLRTLVRLFVVLPMVLPPIVGGVALLFAFGRRGLLGRWMDETLGWTLTFETPGVIVAETWVAMPFFVLAAEAGLRSMDKRYLGAAATLGASPWHSFRRVTLPLVAPALRAGLILTWARALGEFGATITFAGSLAGTTRTLPLAIHAALESDPQAALALSLVMVAVSAALLFVLRHRWFPAR